MRRCSFIFFFILAHLFSTSVSQAYYGAQSTEAELKFETVVDVMWSPTGSRLGSLPTLKNLNGTGYTHRKALDLVNKQIRHLMGTFQAESFKESFHRLSGLLGEQKNYDSPHYKQTNFSIKFTDVRNGQAQGRLLLSYKFKGKSVFDQKAFKNGPLTTVPLTLPLAPDLIYSQSFNTEDDFNYCTDEHYNTEGDFWYFWDTQKSNCPLAQDNERVLRLNADLKQLPNSEERYPNYRSLYGDNKNGKVLKISVMLGYVDDLDPNNKKGHTKDTTYKNFKIINQDLLDQGFKLIKDDQHFKNKFALDENLDDIDGINYLREYMTTIHTKNDKDVEVHIQVLLSDTSNASDDDTFHKFLLPAFEDSDIVIYDGHSGLGGNLNLNYLPKVNFQPKKYQIFFFNGCSSYSYYNGMFFDAKQGSGYLDIVNAGLETSSSSTAPNVLSFMKYIIRGDLKSYKTLLSTLEKSNGAENGTYLTGVSGEKDNTFKPTP